MNLKASFVDFLHRKYPHLSVELLNQTISENLLSPFQVSLSPKVIQSIKDEIKNYWNLRQWGARTLQSAYRTHGLRRPTNFAACMSYDFHLSSEQKPELIEINTNASFLALGLEMYSFLKQPQIVEDFNEDQLVNMFKNENTLVGQKNLNLCILDENPVQQKLYLEFLIYQSIFKKHGVSTDIAHLDDLEIMKKSSLVYNRFTDFYLQTEKSIQIKKLFNDEQIQLSPNPYEYFLLADKQRMIDWTNQTEVAKPQSLLPTYDMAFADKEKIWTERKNLFFKPKNSYGSKQVYKGASISRKVFEDVTQPDFIAQKISHAPEIEVLMNDQKVVFRYDLRCYAYQDELQMIVARLYQGQTTNLRTPGGGFACVIQS